MAETFCSGSASVIAARRLERAQYRTGTSSAVYGAHWTGQIAQQAPVNHAGPWDFSQAAGLDEDTRSRIRNVLLTGSASDNFCLRGGEVSLMDRDPCMSKLLSLSECADGDCGCFRLTKPWVRASMARCVAQCAAAASSGTVRYLSVGCGMLLTDLEVLCALQAAGGTIESATFVDEGLGVSASVPTPNPGIARQLASSAGLADHLPSQRYPPAARLDSLQTSKLQAALSEVAAFLAPARVVAYSSTAALATALLAEREASYDVLVHVDAALISRRESRSLASLGLRDGGVAVRLVNHGARQAATLDIWRRKLGAAQHGAVALGRARSAMQAAQAAPHVLPPPDTDALLDTLVDAWPVLKDGSALAIELSQVEQALRGVTPLGPPGASAARAVPPALCIVCESSPTGGRMPEFLRHAIR